MTKPELIAKFERDLASAIKRASKMDNPAGYSGEYMWCETCRQRITAAKALPDDWQGESKEIEDQVQKERLAEIERRYRWR